MPEGKPEIPTAPPHKMAMIERLCGLVAILGGLLALACALLVSVSVLGRWLFSLPIEGDFEYVKMATAIAVFSYLPYTQVRRGNIMVDTFTTRLPRRAQGALDTLWDLAYALFMAFCTYALWFGTLEAFHNGQTTMQKQIPLWPSIGLCMLLSALVAITALLTAWQRLGLASPPHQADL